MADKIELDVVGRDYNLEVVEYSVSEDITPLAPGDSSGGVGSISVTVLAKKDGPYEQRTGTIVDRDIILHDGVGIDFTNFKGRGTVFGHVNKNVEPGARTKLTAETLLARLNTDRAAAPYFGVRRTGQLVTYVVNNYSNPSLETGTTGFTAAAGTGGTVGFTRVNSPATPYSGTWYGRAAWTVAATTPGGINVAGTVTGGTANTYSAFLRMGPTGRAAQTIRASIQFYTGGTPVGTAVTGEPVAIANGAYNRVSVYAVAPDAADNYIISFFNYNSGLPGQTFGNWANGDILLIDGVMMTQGVTLYDFFDGSSSNASWLGTANASASQQAIFTNVDEGYDATIANAMRYYCGLVGIEQTSIIVDSVFEGVPVAYPAWEGNVWNMLKQLCVAVGAEIALSGSSIVFRQPRAHVIQQDNADSFVVTMDTEATALAVEVNNYNNQWRVDSPVFVADNTYSIDVNSYTTVNITVDADLVSVNNPRPVIALSNPDTYVGSGEYVIIDANDVVVAPATWTALRAGITAAIDADDPSKVTLTIIGPGSAGDYEAPFRVASTSVFGDLPSLIITGEGVFRDVTPITIGTAASLSQTSNELAPTVDNPFISTASQAVDRGVLAAMQASGPHITLDGFVTYDSGASGNEFGTFVGGRIKHDNGIYRVRSASFTPGGIDFSAEADTIFGDVTEAYSITFAEANALYVGMNFNTYNALWGSQTFNQVMGSIPQPTFNDINKLYAGMSFNDHARYPLITKLTGGSNNAATRF